MYRRLTSAVGKSVVAGLAVLTRASDDVRPARTLASEFVAREAARAVWVALAEEGTVVVVRRQRVDRLAAESGDSRSGK